MKAALTLIFLAILLVASCATSVSETELLKELPKDDPAREHIDPFACQSDADCTTGGCSSTICQSEQGEQMMSICDWREEYACYNSISCGCNEGRCAWEKTPAFESCIVEKGEAKGETSGEVQ